MRGVNASIDLIHFDDEQMIAQLWLRLQGKEHVLQGGWIGLVFTLS